MGKIFQTNLNHHSYTFFLKGGRINKLYWKENPATCFLEEQPTNPYDDQGEAHQTRARPKTNELISQQQCDRFMKVEKQEIQVDHYGKDTSIITEGSYEVNRSKERKEKMKEI